MSAPPDVAILHAIGDVAPDRPEPSECFDLARETLRQADIGFCQLECNLTDRGVLRPGLAADITVFDPATIHDVATFEQPNRYSAGIRHVFVNGTAVVADGAITAARPGRPLRGPSSTTQN